MLATMLRRTARTTPFSRYVLPFVQRHLKGGRVLTGPAAGLRIELGGGNPGILLGMSEPPVQGFAASATPADVFWDVGANIGFFTLIAARQGAEVHAFEPHPTAAAALRRNLNANRLAADVHEFALSDRDDDGFLDTNRVHAASLADSGAPVTLRRADQLRLSAPTFVKIDVDGSEAAVLAGMRATLAEHRPRIALELHDTLAECAPILAELGYEWRIVDDGGMPHLFTV